MPDIAPLRQRARALRAEILTQVGDNPATLTHAGTLLRAATRFTGLIREPVSTGDPLLAGGHAALYRIEGGIYYEQGATVSAAQSHFAQAHEFGHWFLHPDAEQDVCIVEDEQLTLFASPDVRSYSADIAEGYSRTERREREANLFAAEWLLPAPLLAHAYRHEKKTPAQIAQIAGVSERLVLSQLVTALLEPTPEPITESSDYGLDLDPSQAHAAFTDDCPALIDAGPGTGKTRTLIARIRWLIQEKNVSPDSILALTFSIKAAEEIRSRLRLAVGEAAELVWIGTFHGFGYELLKKDGHYLGLPLAPSLMEPADAAALLERHIDQLNLDRLEYLHNPGYALGDILQCISRAKDELISPEAYAAAAQAQSVDADVPQADDARKTQETAHVYTVYQALLQERGALDFGDLLMRSVELLDKFSEVRARWQAQFPHILADEYQDINRASARLLQCLVGNGRGFWAVGDARQAIYRFRGASPVNMARFAQDFPGGTRLRLTVNYRARTPLVELLGASTDALFHEPHESEAPRQRWTAERGVGNATAIRIAQADDEDAETDGIAASIRQWESEGVPAEKQAILCRTNAQCALMTARLRERGLAAQHLGRLFEREEVKDILAILALLIEPDGNALRRIARFPEYAIPEQDVRLLQWAARREGRGFPEAMAWGMNELPDLSDAARRGLRLLWEQIHPLLYGKHDAFGVVTRYLFVQSHYLESFLDDDTPAVRQKRHALARLLSFIQGLQARLNLASNDDPKRAFLAAWHSLRGHQGENDSALTMESTGEGVIVLTVHKAKGLEFPVVYVPNLLDGKFPIQNQNRMVTPPEICLRLPDDTSPLPHADEEACLFFVALSRARDQVVLSCAPAANGKSLRISPFLTALLPAALEIGAIQEHFSPQRHRDTEDAQKNTKGTSENTADTEQAQIPEAQDQKSAPSSLLPSPSPEFSAGQIETYWICPRRFYYEHRAGLTPTANEPGYLGFHQSVGKAWEQVRLAAKHGTPLTPQQAQNVLNEAWQAEFGTTETAYVQLLRKRAEEMLTQAVIQPQIQQGGIQQTYTARLPHGNVRVSGEAVEATDEGVRITQYKRRVLKDKDRNEERLALLRRAVSDETGQPTDIVLHSLKNGETLPVPPSEKWEAKRVQKYDDALAGIQKGNFPPRPSDRTCGECPFFLLCPQM